MSTKFKPVSEHELESARFLLDVVFSAGEQDEIGVVAAYDNHTQKPVTLLVATTEGEGGAIVLTPIAVMLPSKLNDPTLTKRFEIEGCEPMEDRVKPKAKPNLKAVH